MRQLAIKPNPYAPPLRGVKPTRYVVSISSGASSAVAAWMAIKRWGKENCEFVFCDVLIEDEDNYRFLDDVAAYLGINVKRLVAKENPYQLAERRKLIPNSRMAPCTGELKIKPFLAYCKGLQAKGFNVVVVLGLDANETKRMEAPRRNYGEHGMTVSYPLTELKDTPLNVVRSWKLTPPRMYAMGFDHSNCGKLGCVKSGALTWRRFLEHFPERFKETEEWEARMRENPSLQNYSILKRDGSGNFPLSELRAKVEDMQATQPRLLGLELDLRGCSVDCGASWQDEEQTF